MDSGDKNTLYYGDNIDILRDYIKDDTIDLVYLDPPFNSKQIYNIIYHEKDGTQSAAQVRAFTDTWKWDEVASKMYDKVVEAGGPPSTAMQALRTLLGDNDMLAYLSIMAPRFIELRRVLKPTGSIYLHCDPTASHYLKIIMDSIFGPDQFRNEIIWRRTGAHGTRRSFGPIHDTILFYSKSKDYYFNIVKKPYMKGHVESRYREDSTGKMKFTTGGNILTGSGITKGESGKPWKGFDPSKKNRHWAIPGYLSEQMPADFYKLGVLGKLDALYMAGLVEILPDAEWPTPVKYLKDDDGQPCQDIWSYQPYTEGTVYGNDEGIDQDVAWLGTTDPERLGYPTQKPVGLLNRIILSSCPPDGTVLDPFCGCGTTIEAAQQLNRRWIGIDITHLAITLIRSRMNDIFPGAPNYVVVGEPVDIEGAKSLSLEDRYQFQWWALGKVGARPVSSERKKGADKGIDGKLFFHEVEGGPTKKIIISVKSGKVQSRDVRDLIGVVGREKAQIGALLTLEKPSRPMVKEAVNAGFYKPDYAISADEKYPMIQILTIEDLLEGKNIDYPHLRNVTYRKAVAKPKKATQKKGRQIRFT